MDACALRYIYHFKIPQAVPLSGHISFSDLAAASGLDEPRLRRILRYLMTSNIFNEPEIGFVEHTALSALLVTDRAAQGYIGHCVEISYPLNVKFVEAIEKWGNDGELNHTAANLAHNTDLPFYQFMMTHPDKSVSMRFQGLMDGLSASEGFSVKHTVHGFDWASVGNGTVVDVSPIPNFPLCPSPILTRYITRSEAVQATQP
jgi:6-hydroxytryprostatin B O-methyltransferase